MKPESYFAWDAKPVAVLDSEWRAPEVEPRPRGLKGALTALAARLRPADAV